MNRKILKIGVMPIIFFGIILLFSENIFEENVFADLSGFTATSTVAPPFPRIIALTASDPDGLDAIYSDGDVITITFDKPTNRPPAATKADLQNLFTFSQSLGNDFTGSWISASVLQITVVDDTGATPPAIGVLTLTVKASGNLRNEAGTSLPSTSTSPTLSGDFGNRAGPSITSLVAADPSNDDAIYDSGDTITVRFNENTNTPPVNTKAALDALFTYTQGGVPASLGTNYQGVFTNERTLVITILDATGATPPAIGGLILTVKASGNLLNEDETSLASVAVSPPLSGTFGTAPGPFFLSLVANDPDGGDAVYGAGDTITATFSKATNQPFGPNLIKSELDTLFIFSQDLGADYTGFWADSVTLVITIQDPFGAAPPTVGNLQLTAKPSGNLRDAANTSLPSTALSPTLTGNFGTKAGPAITAFTVSDPDGLDAIYSNGDVFTITFDVPTNRPQVTTKANLDALFSFSQNLGNNYVGTWTTPSILKITALDVTGSSPPSIGVLTATVKASGNLRNEAGTSLASVSVAPPLAGSFGDKVGPAFTSLVAADPSNDDAIFDNGDTITARFDVDTNQPPVNNKNQLDQLFTFSQEIGDNYNGVWLNPKTLQITILDDTVDTPPRIGELKLIVKASGNLRNAANTSLPSTAVSPALSGTFGTAPGPSFTSLVANDPDGADAVYSNGDTITAKFNTATNTPPVATKANLDALFSFSQNLGTGYTGQWIDDVTLVITVTNAIGATPPKADVDGVDDGELRLTVKASGNLKNKANTSLASTATSPLLTGNFGTKQGPQIATMVAGDPPPTVPGYSIGDTITITFNEKTNRPLAATKADINNIFSFSQSLGAGYVGSWQSASILIITVTDPTGATPPAPSVLTATIKASANLKNEAGTSLASTSSAVLIGNFGLEPGPAIESATASDPSNDDAVFDAGDIFTLRYDKDTNQPFGPSLDRSELDSLLIFSQQIGDDYTGTWVNAKTLRITVVDDTVDFPPQIGELQFTVKDKVLQTAGSASAFSTSVSPPLGGTFGTAPGPFITDLVARDPFGLDAVFGENDIITVVFERATNEVFGPTLDKAELDTLFTFSDSLGNDYTGVWFEPEILEITIVDPGSANPVIGTFGLEVNGAAGLKDAAGTSLSSTDSSPPLVGNFGTRAGPQLEIFEADDPSNQIGLTNGDIFRLTFDEATNEPPVSTKAEIDAIFSFSDSLGTDYTGEWFDPRTLQITVTDVTGGAVSVDSTTVSVLSSGNLKNSANTSLNSETITPVILSGDLGQAAGPAIISLIAHDPDNLDSFFSNGDTLTVIFDTKTTEPPVATKTQLDNLFTFSQTIGDDYTGTWNNLGDLVITIVDGEQLPQAPIIGELQVIAKATGNIQAVGGSLPSTSESPFVTGSWGNFIEQVSVCEGGEAFSTFPDGKTAEISYSGDEECGGFTFEVADETTSNRIEFVGDPVTITPIGNTDCSVAPHCLLAFVFRENQIPLEGGVPVDPFTRVKILKDVNGDQIILQDFDGNGDVSQSDLDASNEVFNGLPLAGIVIGGNIFDTPQTTVIALDDVRFEASATTPSNSKFAIGGIKSLALGALGPSISGPSAPSTSTASAGTGTGTGGTGGAGGGGGGNAASVGGEGFAGVIDSTQVRLYEATWDKCEEKKLRVIAGPAGPGLSVKAIAAMGGIIAMKEAAEQPFSKATVYETDISELETFIRVQVEGVIGREASLAQRSLDLRQCSGSIGGYSEAEIPTPTIGASPGAIFTGIPELKGGAMFETKYNGIDFGVGYKIPAGKITKMDVNTDEKSITFEFSNKVSGKVLLSLPRVMINANNDQFVVLDPATSQRISYDVIESGSQYVTLEMTPSTEVGSVMVVGTTVVPEFGAIAMVILVISIVCIVIISRTKYILKIKL